MSETAITGGVEGGTPPAAPTPAATVPKAGSSNEGSVTLTKEEHDNLVKASQDLEIAKNLQAQADRRAAKLEKLIGRRGNSPFAKSDTTPPAAPTKEELDLQGAEEDRKAERGLIAFAIDPKYRDLLDNDPTLRSLLTTNPLGVLPLLAPEALDAEDAIDLVKAHLDTRLLTFKKPTAPGAPILPPDKTTPPTPPAGGVNTSGNETDEAYSAAKKIGNTEKAISEMVKVSIGRMGKK